MLMPTLILGGFVGACVLSLFQFFLPPALYAYLWHPCICFGIVAMFS